MKTSAFLRNTKNPYLFNMFNIQYFFANQHKFKRNPLLHIYNAFIEGLNCQAFLPKYLLIVPNCDIIDAYCPDTPGQTKQLESAISWITRQITSKIEDRKEFFRQAKPGALPPSDSLPTIIWIAMHDWPFRAGDFGLTSCCKFNRGINEVAIKEKNVRVLDPSEKLSFADHFKSWGKLNYAEKLQFWCTINNKLQVFEQAGGRGLNPHYYISDLELQCQVKREQAIHQASLPSTSRADSLNRCRDDECDRDRRHNLANYRRHYARARVSLFEKFTRDSHDKH